MVAASNLGLLLDIWDVVACGGCVESVRNIPASQIVAVQVADMPAGVAAPDLDDKSRLLPGVENGRIDLAALLAILRELGYNGPITAKPSRALPSRCRDVVVKQVSEALDKAWRAAGLPTPPKTMLATARVARQFSVVSSQTTVVATAVSSQFSDDHGLTRESHAFSPLRVGRGRQA